MTLPIQQLTQLAGHIGGTRAQQIGDFIQSRFFFADVGQGTGTGHRFNTPYAGGHAAFGNDLEHTDVTGPTGMRAAAQFGRERAHLQHAHFFAVLLAKQRHRAKVQRFLHAHVMHFHRDIAADLGIDQGFHLGQLGARHRLEMREVETQPLGRDLRAPLRHMITQHLAQRGVQQMGRTVIEHDGLTTCRIDFAAQRIAHLQDTLRQRADMAEIHPGQLLRVGHIEL